MEGWNNAGERSEGVFWLLDLRHKLSAARRFRPLIKIKISPHLLGVKECSDASLLGVIVEDQKRGLI
jgi:hypothetical protein